jgi:hypothetical protein
MGVETFIFEEDLGLATDLVGEKGSRRLEGQVDKVGEASEGGELGGERISERVVLCEPRDAEEVIEFLSKLDFLLRERGKNERLRIGGSTSEESFDSLRPVAFRKMLSRVDLE